jgi:formate hydrogenlyase subunit 6/NADH:ubiquinone oxidoreductase subunit I
MNAMGKELIAKRIVVAIKLTLKVHNKKPISMKWKEDPSKDKSRFRGSKKWRRKRKRTNRKPERQCFNGK